MPRRAETTLTDTAVRNLRPRETRYEVRDASRPGFGVRVELDGRKVFFQRFGTRGERRLNLGTYSSSFGLSKARSAADKARAEFAAGQDPIAAKKEERRKERQEREARKAAREGQPGPGTFADLTERYLRDARRRRRERSVREAARKLKVEVLPGWGPRMVAEIRRADVLRLIEEARERGGVCSNRTLALVRAIFQYAVDREELDANPALRIPRRFLYTEKPRERVLSEEELRVLWPLFDRLQPAVAAAWRLVLLTAQRPGEVLSMRWRDLERDTRGWWWNLPAEMTKTNSAHRVPLSPQALAVVEALRPLTGSTEWVLASRADGKRLTWLSHSSARLRAWSGLPHFTPHDLRRTAATWLGRSGVRPDTIDHLLNHAAGRITRTYNRASYDAEKRQAVILLGDRVEAVLAGEERSNVVRIA
ncbi:MAG TPA: tyrosine-type recombinase/integrase [Thermoanaerobaculia bacterium]|jgi:integrase|nr:tyrosine-type recombinase/integrase [Thermoanaerobaculia bacterium]